MLLTDCVWGRVWGERERERGKKNIFFLTRQPLTRFELATPCLQGRCNNHYATTAQRTNTHHQHSVKLWRNWQRVGFQTRRLGVRIPLASAPAVFFFFLPRHTHRDASGSGGGVGEEKKNIFPTGVKWESNPRPLAPKARIIPLDH